MADRQDIDALMVGALYGELDADERARLEAHLSSHPEDQAAMHGLEAARATVRRGMTEMAPIEPPQAVSAMLLQEAARRRAPTVTATEPAEREGLWDRFFAWFRPLAGHPALAGAAALILVAGTATALWMRGKGGVTEPTTTSMSTQDQATPPTAEPGAAMQGDQGAMATGAGSGTSYEVAGVVPDPADGLDRQREGQAVAVESSGAGKGASSGGGKAAPKVRKPGAEMGIAVDGKADVPQIKDLDEEDTLAQEAGDDDVADGYAQRTTSGAKAQQPEPAIVDPQLEAWAKGEHQKLVRLVKASNCPDAGRVGAELKAKAPDYYAANVANDRDIRQCKQYIEKLSKKKAEKDYKSRSQGNTYDADEAVDAN